MALKTIAIEEADFLRLEPLKVHPRETYGDVIRRLIDLAEGAGAPVEVGHHGPHPKKVKA